MTKIAFTVEKVNNKIFDRTFYEGCPITFEFMNRELLKERGVTYKPFNVAWFGNISPTVYSDEVNTVILSHDVMHALSFFINKKYDKLMMDDFGFVSKDVLSVKAFKTEINIIAMQYASLCKTFECETHFKNVVTDHLYINREAYLADDIAEFNFEAYMQEKFKYWSDRYSFLSESYKEMTNWMIIKMNNGVQI